VNVRVIPIQAGRFIRRNAKAVLKRTVLWLNRRVEHFILMACRGDGQSVEVEIRRRRGHQATDARIRFAFIARVKVMIAGWSNATEIGQIVLQIENKKIIWTQPQIGRLFSVRRHVAVTSRTIRFLIVVQSQINRQFTIDTAQIFRIHDRTSRQSGRAGIVRHLALCSLVDARAHLLRAKIANTPRAAHGKERNSQQLFRR